MPTATSTPAEVRRAGAEAIAERLYSQQRPRLLAIARRNCANSDDAEEALHDAFLLFIDHFDPAGEAPALPWLTLTLKRRCWALYARRRKGPRPVAHGRLERIGGLGPRAPQELCEVAEEATRLRRDLAALKPDQRRALALLALGYTYERDRRGLRLDANEGEPQPGRGPSAAAWAGRSARRRRASRPGLDQSPGGWLARNPAWDWGPKPGPLSKFAPEVPQSRPSIVSKTWSTLAQIVTSAPSPAG